MSTFVALLRGINVSGQRTIPMAALRRSCEVLGWKEVRTYLQSGNVVFRAGRADPRKLAEALKGRIAKDFGHDVEVLVLPAKELGLVASSNPLWPRSGGEGRLFHSTFLLQRVAEDRFRRLDLPVQPRERAILVGQVVLLY